MSKLKQRLKVLTTINTLALGSMYMINQAISSSALIKNILNPDKGDYYHWKFGDIFYKKAGTGSPVLLIHDLNSFSSGYEWSQLEEKLKKDYTVYTIDLLGCGRSSKPALKYTNYLYVQLLTDFINEVIKEKTSVICTGLSSSFVIMTTYSNSKLIDRIIMINPASLKTLNKKPDQKSRVVYGIMSIPIVGTSLFHMKSCRQNIKAEMEDIYFYRTSNIKEKYINAYYESAHYGYGKGKYLMSSLDGNYLNIPVEKALSNIENNITILYGDKTDNGKAISRSYRKINKNISTHAVANTKHLPQLESVQQTYTQIKEYLL